MNTSAITLVCLTLAQQVPPSQFAPVEEASPLGAAAVISDDVPTSSTGITDSPAANRYESATEPRAFSRPSVSISAPARLAAPPAAATEMPADGSLETATRILQDAVQAASAEGQAVALVDVLKQAEASVRKQSVEAYWRLYLDLAEQGFAFEEAQFLSQLPLPRSPADQAAVQACLARAEARQSEATLSVLVAQEQLGELFSVPGDTATIPADVPYVGPYRTNLETIFAGRPVPTRLKQIDRILPQQLDLIQRRAKAVAASERLLAELVDAYSDATASLERVLESLKQLSDERRRFAAAVLAYNQQIADYALAVVSPAVKPETLLGTLIRSDRAVPTMIAAANVRPASAEQPVLEDNAARDNRELVPTPQRQEQATPSAPADDRPTQSILKRVSVTHQ